MPGSTQSHPNCELLNSPDYYWNQAVDAWERMSWYHFWTHSYEMYEEQMYMYLFLYEMSIQGD